MKIGKEVNQDDIQEICKDIFHDKKYIVRELEVFGDSTQINVESITDEEKTNLLNKINEKYETEKTVEDIKVNSVPNKRIRDTIKPYILPTIISFLIVFVYILIRYRKVQPFKIIFTFIINIILMEAIFLSTIAIARIPVNDIAINLLVVVAIAGLVINILKNEKKLDDYVGDYDEIEEN